MTPTMSHAFKKNFLGNSPGWYESAIIAFLVFNPLILYVFGPFIIVKYDRAHWPEEMKYLS